MTRAEKIATWKAAMKEKRVTKKEEALLAFQCELGKYILENLWGRGCSYTIDSSKNIILLIYKSKGDVSAEVVKSMDEVFLCLKNHSLIA